MGKSIPSQANSIHTIFECIGEKKECVGAENREERGKKGRIGDDALKW